jgi:alanine racemase
MLKPTSVIEIDANALSNNFHFLKGMFGKTVKVSSVVKGNAYGHGIEVFVPLAEQCGQDHFSVYSADEAWRVLEASKGKPDILIMGSLEHDQIEWAIENNIEFFVFEFERLYKAANIAKKMGRKALVHIEVETGMNRTGFNRKEVVEVAKVLKENLGYLEFKGLCTHFAGAESIANYARIRQQKVEYRRALKWFHKHGLMPQQRHASCSAAAARYPDMRLDMVRIGIMQYGFWPSQEVYIEFLGGKLHTFQPLRRLITWKSRVMSVKQVRTGEFIGYGTSFLASKDMQVAIIPVGYSHGFSRSLSNQGHVLIHGKRAAVVGTVNMNCLAVDATGLENVQYGDEVVLIGKQDKQEITVASFGELSSQMNYELLTRLPMDIPRKVVNLENRYEI